MIANDGFLYIIVNDGVYMKNGELYLNQSFEDMELDVKYLEKLFSPSTLMGKTCSYGNKDRTKARIFTFDGKTVHWK